MGAWWILIAWIAVGFVIGVITARSEFRKYGVLTVKDALECVGAGTVLGFICVFIYISDTYGHHVVLRRKDRE